MDAAGLQLASRNAAGQLQGWQLLATTADLLFPGELRVYCVDTGWLRKTYPAAPPGSDAGYCIHAFLSKYSGHRCVANSNR